MLLAISCLVLHPVSDLGLFETQIWVLGSEMLRRLGLVAPIAVVPIENLDPLLKGGILSVREFGLDCFLFARRLTRWDYRLRFRPFKCSV